jgi:glycosyltransferase involved in cell wall biosynthesis
MFSSTIIPTINRSTLSVAVESVLDQKFNDDDFEVIVVNDSGKPLPQAAWQKVDCVRVVDTNRRERSVARNTGAAIAKGDYLHFLDDDDILLPGALHAFWELAKKEPQADWLYGSWRTVDNDGRLVDEFRPDLFGNIFARLVAGEGLPLQASLLKSGSFFGIGGYDTDPLLTGVEDRDLGRRMALRGRIAHAAAVVAQVRIGEVGSSTNWKVIASGDQWGREKVLRADGALRRVFGSADSSFWHGRASRAYLASMAWNLRQRSLLIATHRFLAALALTGFYALAPGFWRGLSFRRR